MALTWLEEDGGRATLFIYAPGLVALVQCLKSGNALKSSQPNVLQMSYLWHDTTSGLNNWFWFQVGWKHNRIRDEVKCKLWPCLTCPARKKSFVIPTWYISGDMPNWCSMDTQTSSMSSWLERLLGRRKPYLPFHEIVSWISLENTLIYHDILTEDKDVENWDVENEVGSNPGAWNHSDNIQRCMNISIPACKFVMWVASWIARTWDTNDLKNSTTPKLL